VQIKSQKNITVKNDSYHIKEQKDIEKILNGEVAFNADILSKKSIDIENALILEK